MTTNVIKQTHVHTQTAPDLAIGRVEFRDILQVLDGLGELFRGAQDGRHGAHAGYRPLIMS